MAAAAFDAMMPWALCLSAARSACAMEKISRSYCNRQSLIQTEAIAAAVTLL